MNKVKVMKNDEFIKNYKKMSPEKKLAFKQVLTNCQDKLQQPVWKKKMFKK